MNSLPSDLQTISTQCSLCHDQCVSACPVVEMTHRQIAYPSRLATLAWELDRGNLAADAETMRAMLHCVHCNACTDACVYVDTPVDVTPLVRHARRILIENGQASPQMRQMYEEFLAWGNPYRDLHPIYEALKGEFSQNIETGGTLVIADACELAYAPDSARASLRLLQQAGYRPMALADQTYTGWELWQYGYRGEALKLAEALAGEIRRRSPVDVITLNPTSAYLLRKVFPDDLGISIPANVITVPEAIQARLDQALMPLPERRASVYLVMSSAETYQLYSYAARHVLDRCGITGPGIQKHQPYHRASFPEGLHPDISPTPGDWIAERIARSAAVERPDAIVCTAAFGLKAMREACPVIPVVDWSNFVMDHMVIQI